MICKKCDNPINSGTKCLHCGYDNNDAVTEENPTPAKVYKRTPVLIAVMLLFIAVDIIKILINIGGIFDIQLLKYLNVNIHLSTGLGIRSWVVPYVFEIIPVITFANMPIQVYYIIQIPFILVYILLLCMCMFKLKKWAFNAYVGLMVCYFIIQISSYAMVAFISKFLLLLVVYIVDVKRWSKKSHLMYG